MGILKVRTKGNGAYNETVWTKKKYKQNCWKKWKPFWNPDFQKTGASAQYNQVPHETDKIGGICL